MPLATIVVSGGPGTGAQGSLTGSVSFTPSTTVTDATDHVIVEPVTLTYPLVAGRFTSGPLVCTDNGNLLPAGWTWIIAVQIDVLPRQAPFNVLLPSTLGPTVDLSQLQAVVPQAGMAAYLLLTGGILSGPVTLSGSPPMIVPGATTGKVLTSDASGNITPQAPQGGIPSGSAGGDLGSTYPNPTVTATHLAAALPVAQGGTGQATQQAAINALTGTQSAGKVLRSDGTNVTLAALQAGDVPTLNQSTTGTAAGLSSTLAIGSGGTGQVTAAAAFNALSPLTTLGDLLYGGASGAGTRLAGDTSNTRKFLRTQSSGGTAAAPAWDTLQSADIPANAANTSGTAAGLSLTLAIGSGGTGATTQQAALDALAGAVTTGLVLRGNGTHVTLAALQAADIPAIAESGVTNLVSDLAAKAPLASPALTGTPTAPTAAAGDSSTQIATDAFVAASNAYFLRIFAV